MSVTDTLTFLSYTLQMMMLFVIFTFITITMKVMMIRFSNANNVKIIYSHIWNTAGNPDPQLASQDDLRAGDQHCSCGESE